jgi:hypothetical protein
MSIKVSSEFHTLQEAIERSAHIPFCSDKINSNYVPNLSYMRDIDIITCFGITIKDESNNDKEYILKFHDLAKKLIHIDLDFNKNKIDGTDLDPNCLYINYFGGGIYYVQMENIIFVFDQWTTLNTCINFMKIYLDFDENLFLFDGWQISDNKNKMLFQLFSRQRIIKAIDKRKN